MAPILCLLGNITFWCMIFKTQNEYLGPISKVTVQLILNTPMELEECGF